MWSRRWPRLAGRCSCCKETDFCEKATMGWGADRLGNCADSDFLRQGVLKELFLCKRSLCKSLPTFVRRHSHTPPCNGKTLGTWSSSQVGTFSARARAVGTGNPGHS